jgi:heterodisulfide reductase subunit A-like polyferredoxin
MAAVNGSDALAFITDCKYGYRGNNDSLSVTLINTAEYPDPFPERGEHTIRLWITPAASDPKALAEIAGAYCHSVNIVSGGKHNGKLPLQKEIIKYEAASTVLSSLGSVDKNTVLVRGYESAGKKDKVKLARAGGCLLDEEPKEVVLEAGAIVIATGWKPYDVTKLTRLGAGAIRNCVSNMQLERLASPFGPTQGIVKRPSDGRAPRSVAFVQCAGSRDQNHLNFCSYICCMASLKQALYLSEQDPDMRITIFYIDLRTPGRYRNVLEKVQAAPNVRFVKGKVAGITEDHATGNVTLTAEDAVRGEKLTLTYDMAVLAAGMQPTLAGEALPLPVSVDEDGFVVSGEEAGIFAAGCARMPLDVMHSARSGASAAMKAVQTARGR